MIFPFRIETLFLHYPRANWALIAAMVVFFFTPADWYDWETIEAMVLQDWSVAGLLGHMWLHGGLMHLVGNMVVLWVFGNAICGNLGNLVYLPLFVALGVVSGAVHLLADGTPMVGASGAINGVVGIALAMYPLNRVSVFWWVWLRFGTFQISLWVLALLWVLMDTFGLLTGGEEVAHWAHLGGLACGLVVGWLALRLGWVELTEFDNRSLEEIFSGKTAEARRDRIRAEQEPLRMAERERRHGGLAGTAAAQWAERPEPAGDPLVMPATAALVADWSRRASQTEVSAEDAARIQAGGEDGARRQFELLYGASFGAMGYSFHRSLAEYFRRAGTERLQPHEGPALASFLRMVEEEFAAMRACGFVGPELAALRDEARLAAFLRATA